MKSAKFSKVPITSESGQERPSLASPYELASIAISLASLQHKAEPDIEGAVKLLRAAALRAQTEKRPVMFFPDSVLCEDEAGATANREAFERMGAKTVVQSPQSHPDEYRAAIEQAKGFTGADSITPPKKFPAQAMACWRALLKRSPSNLELTRKKAAILKACPSAASSVNVSSVYSELAFWAWVRSIIQHLPRKGDTSKKTRRSRQKGSAGQFLKPHQGGDGRFKK